MVSIAQQQFPQISNPLVDLRSGQIQQTWLQLLIALWKRTGGGPGTDPDQIVLQALLEGNEDAPEKNIWDSQLFDSLPEGDVDQSLINKILALTDPVDANSKLLKTVEFTGTGDINILPVTDLLLINKTVGGATTVHFTNQTLLNKEYTIKDAKGDAAVNNITLVADFGTIDGAASFVITAPYEAQTVVRYGNNLNLI